MAKGMTLDEWLVGQHLPEAVRAELPGAVDSLQKQLEQGRAYFPSKGTENFLRAAEAALRYLLCQSGVSLEFEDGKSYLVAGTN